MNTCRLLNRCLPFVALAGLLCIPVIGADAPKKTARPAIYDEKADGTKQIADALSVAKKEHKLVLLQFGANWCGWCHKLHKLFASDDKIIAKLKEAYVVVLVDVNQEHNGDTDEKYGKPTKHGLPVIVVVDAEGKPLTTQDTGKLEEGDHHDPAEVSPVGWCVASYIERIEYSTEDQGNLNRRCRAWEELWNASLRITRNFLSDMVR